MKFHLATLALTIVLSISVAAKPPQPIPEEAEKAMIKGGVFMKEAKDVDGFGKAAASFERAVAAAPGWGDAHYNLGVAREAQGKYDLAAKSFEQAAKLSTPEDAKKIKRRLYALEAKAELKKDGDDAHLVVPGVGIGPLKLGMSSKEIRALMPQAFKHFEYPNREVVSSDNFHIQFRKGRAWTIQVMATDAYKTEKGIAVGMLKTEAYAKGRPSRTNTDKNTGTDYFCYEEGMNLQLGQGAEAKVQAVEVRDLAEMADACRW